MQHQKKGVYIFSEKNKKINYNYQIEFNNLKAPIKKGEIIGKTKVYINDKLHCEINVISNENINRISYKDSLKEVVENW